MAAIELVIFDCDGTVMDTELLAAEVETEALAEFGSKMTPKEFCIRFAGTSSEKVKEVMEEELGRALPDNHIKDVKAKMRERLWREAKTMPGAHEMLDMLDQPRCICSNADMEKLKVELSRGELWDRFRPYVFSAHDLPNNKRKPEPDIFLHAAKEFDADPKNCVVVEDSIAGVTAGKAAGMRVVGFTGGSHNHPALADQLTDAGAETVVRRLADIPAVVETFGLWDGADV
ncbi:MAG: HAD family phosphatase [Pseudomonadota bacterium]